MGYLINPTGYRLSYFKNWSDQWITSNNFLYSQILHNIMDLKKLLIFFFDNFIFEKYGILYSHFYIEQVNNDFKINIYFYDSFMEKKIIDVEDVINTINKKDFDSFDSFIRIFNSNKSKFLKVNFLNYLLIKRILFFFLYLINYNLSNSFDLLKLKKSIYNFYFKNFNKIWILFSKYYNRKKINRYDTNSIFFFVNFFLFFLKKYVNKKLEKNLNLKDFNFSIFLNILFLSYEFWKKSQNSFRNFLICNKSFLKKNVVVKKLNFLNFDILNKYLKFFYSIFCRIFFIWFRQNDFFKILNVLLIPFLRHVSFLNIKFEFLGITNDDINAIFLSRFLIKKLELKPNVNRLFYEVGNDLDRVVQDEIYLKGYKFQFKGRLTRRDRVKTIWLKNGLLPLSDVSAKIEYSMNFGVLKNGVCCVRVWLYRGNVNKEDSLYTYRINKI